MIAPAAALKALIESSGYTVFFGGAGVSTESGIPDFCSENGLYSERFDYPPEEMLSRRFFINHTAEFYRFYKERILHPRALPNRAHLALAALERAGRLNSVVTQNIDGLHQAAGSITVRELHGSVHRNICTDCGRTYPLGHILAAPDVPLCACGGVLKPDVVLYGERLDPAVERCK